MILRFAIKIIAVCNFLIPCSVIGQTPLYINEIMSSNGTTIKDEDGDFSDWIEIYNSGAESIDLDGFYISDRPNNPTKWQFPSRIIEPNGFLVVYASSKDKYGAELHTNFNLSKDGETVVLSDSEGNIVDLVPGVDIPRDISYGRYPDGSENLNFFNQPTPGASNVPSLTGKISFSLPSGFYQRAFDLEINTAEENVRIYYTLNGDTPDTTSFLYQHSIALKSSNELEDNPIIYIPTNDSSTQYFYRWREPRGGHFRANVIRARAFRGGAPISPVISSTYFIDPQYSERFNLPVISIITDEASLFDYHKGLFVPGITFDAKATEYDFWTVGNFINRGGDWEREIAIQFFEDDFNLVLDDHLGMRIHGNATRSLPQKSLRLYAREAIGSSSIKHEFFPGDEIQEFQTLILRNSGQGFLTTHLTDAIAYSIIKDWDVEKQNYRPTVLFINGAYWGIINIRERIDKHFFHNRLGVHEDNLDLLEHVWEIQVEAAEGNAEDYIALVEFVQNSDLSDSINYNIVADQIDIENFILYYVAKMFYGVYDWPGNNLEFWRDRSLNGKWRWVFFDNDDAMADASFNSYEHLLDSTDNSWPNPLWSTLMFRKLTENDNFRTQFFETVKRELNNTFHPERTKNIALFLADNIRKEMGHHIDRWQHPESFSAWTSNIQDIIYFLENRPCLFWDMTLSFFDQSSENQPFLLCDESRINEAKEKKVLVYPNPAREEINIEVSNRQFISRFKIYDLAGKLIENSAINLYNFQYKITIPTANYPSGMYIFEMETYQGEVLRGKFILID